MLYAGLYMAIKLSSRMKIESENQNTESSYDEARTTDFGFVFGGDVGFPVRENIIGLEVRYNFSTKHNVFMVMVSFQI